MEEEPDSSVLEFFSGGRRYGVERRYVLEAATIGEITPLPGAPQFFRGVTNVRGEILSVLDLQAFFKPGEPAQCTKTSGSHQGIVVSSEAVKLCFLVDRIGGLKSLGSEEQAAREGRILLNVFEILSTIRASGASVKEGDL